MMVWSMHVPLPSATVPPPRPLPEGTAQEHAGGRVTGRRAARTARQRGQIMVLFGIALPVILIMAGLGIDVGNVYTQRRLAQTAADAAALAGARCLLQQATAGGNDCRPADATYPTPTVPSGQDVQDAITYWVAKNAFGATNDVSAMQWTHTTGATSSITASNTTAATSPSTANGVQVTVRRSFLPIFLNTAFAVMGQVLPSTLVADGHIFVEASATAQIGTIVVPAVAAPLAGCGPAMFTTLGDTTYDIFLPGTTEIDYATYATSAYTFILQSSQLWRSATHPPCPYGGGNDWKGAVTPTGPIALPSTLTLDNGNAAAPVAEACAATGQPAPGAGCYLLFSMTDSNNDTSGTAHIVTFACFGINAGPGGGTEKWTAMLKDPENCLPHYDYGFTSWSKASGSDAFTKVSLRG